jgi:hypothetical protein
MECWQGSQSNPLEFGSIRSRLVKLAARFHVNKLVIESPQGYMLAEQITQIGIPTEILSPTAESNRERWGALIARLKGGTICLPDDPKLRRQLLTLTIQTTATGWKVVDVPSIHNDRAVAIAGALYAATESAATWWISGGPYESADQKRDKSGKSPDPANDPIRKMWGAINNVPLGDLFDDD